MLTQLDLAGADCIQRAIMRIREFEPLSPYILCFSGGKDSTVLKALADEAGVAYEAHYHVTTIDPPDVIRFMHQHHPDVIFDKPEHGKSFAQRIEDKGFPTRTRRWCCAEFKERAFPGRTLLTGLRKAEKRASGAVTLTRLCRQNDNRMVQPMLDWNDGEVWGFIRSRCLPYCPLYDQSWTRIGCICCPFASRAEKARNRRRWPAMFQAIYRGFEKRWAEHWRNTDMAKRFASPSEVFEWWLGTTQAYPVAELDDGLFA